MIYFCNKFSFNDKVLNVINLKITKFFALRMILKKSFDCHFSLERNELKNINH